MRSLLRGYASELSLLAVVGLALAMIVLLGPAEEAQASGVIRRVRPGTDESTFTLQQAINASGDDDTVVVEGGRYTGGILLTKRVNLIGLGAVIDGVGSVRPLTVIGGGIGPEVSITGFTFVGGNATDGRVGFGEDAPTHGPGCGGGVLLQGASPSFRGNTVINSSASLFPDPPLEGEGGGLCLLDSDAVVAENTIASNAAGDRGADGVGGGIYAQGGAPTIRGNTITGNYGSSRLAGRGGGMYLEDTNATVEHNVIRSNTASQCGDPPDTSANDCGDALGIGGGVYIAGGQPVLRFNTIADNLAGSYEGTAGGVFVNRSTVTLLGCLIVGNSHGVSGGQTNGLHIQNSQNVVVESTVIARSYYRAAEPLRQRGRALFIQNSSGTIASTTIADNSPPGIPAASSGGVVVQGNDTDVTFLDTIITGNQIGVWYQSGSGQVTLKRTLFAGNQTDTRRDSGTLNNQDEWLAGAPADQKDPRFVARDAALPDYRLRADSPAHDAGSRQPGSTVDADRRARQIGPAPDLGAYEFPYAVAVAIAASPSSASPGGELTYSYQFAVEGDRLAPGVTLVATLPPGSSDVVPSAGGTVSGESVTWRLGDLAPAHQGLVSVRLRLPDSLGQVVEGRARIASAEGVAFESALALRVGLALQDSEQYLPTVLR